jgi:TolB protein
VDYWNPSHSPDGAQILFESNLDGEETLDLYVMQADGGGLALLREDAQSPVWSPDGTQILFISAVDGDLELYVMNPDGTEVRQLTHDDCRTGLRMVDGLFSYPSRIAGEGSS